MELVGPDLVKTQSVRRAASMPSELGDGIEVGLLCAGQGCVNGVPASKRALAGLPDPPQLFEENWGVAVGFTHGHG